MNSKPMHRKSLLAISLIALASLAAGANGESDQKMVAALDSKYQAAVKNNDAAAMDQILGDDFLLVLGSGKTYSKSDLLTMARTRRVSYEHQEDSLQSVRVLGNVAVVTAMLWAKGLDQGKPFDFHVWFSDTYVRTSSGWRYFHGHASMPLPQPAE